MGTLNFGLNKDVSYAKHKYRVIISTLNSPLIIILSKSCRNCVLLFYYHNVFEVNGEFNLCVMINLLGFLRKVFFQ